MTEKLYERDIYIFTDGGSRMSKGIASFSSVTVLGDIHEQYISKHLSLDRGYNSATNNQMELSGFIAAAIALYIRYTNDPSCFTKVTVVSDSQYLVRGVNEYLPNWQTNGYKTSGKKEIKNLDLWNIIEDILDLCPENMEFEFLWTKGHMNLSEEDSTFASKYNNICDLNCNFIMDDIEGGYYKGDLDFSNFVKNIQSTLQKFKTKE